MYSINIHENLFGSYKDTDVKEYTLDNGKNLCVKVLTLGGTIREINFNGRNRVLGFDNIEDYINSRTYFGALVGRVAGRISNGEIIINDDKIKLDQNEGTTCIHGGVEGFSFKIWELENKEINNDFVSITLRYISPDMECGFPGDLTVFAKYTVFKDDSISIEYFAHTTKDTPITLTNHSYFNLNNDLSENILEHNLKIDANSYIKLNEKNIPTEIASVENTAFDFRKERTIASEMDLSHIDLKDTAGYDHPFILNKSNDSQIVLSSRSSGVQLSISTTEPVVILYCSNKLEEGLVLSEGDKTFNYQGVCLETQWYPDAINQEFLPDNILRLGEEYYSKTIYKFDKISD